jgi:TatD DNase family protein
VGIHPHSASSADDAAFQRLEELASAPRVVGIGETGLDYFYDNAPRAAQRESFQRHLELARTRDLPVVVHSRDADDDLRAILREAGWGRGVLHCFSGGRDLLDEALALGWHISFAGMITFPKWDAADLLLAVPLDRLLVETDSPYLAPVPHRGKRNEPAYVTLVARRAAELRGDDPEALMTATTANAVAFYGVAGSEAA